MLNNLKRVLENRTLGSTCPECQQWRTKLEELEEENKRLSAELSRLKAQRANSIPIGAHTPSSQVPFKKQNHEQKKDTKGGAKKGHKGFGRESIDQSDATKIKKIEAPLMCPSCNQQTVGNGVRERSIIDAPEQKVEKVIYECERSRCSKCGKSYTGAVPALPKALYGNRLMTKVAIMHYLHGIPLGRIQAIFGNDINVWSLIGGLHRMAEIFRPLMPVLTRQYRESLVKFADETSWNTDGKKGWIWLFSSNKTTILLCENNRSASVPFSIFGDDEITGILIVDRYKGYSRVNCFIQFCFAHLLRDVKKLLIEFPDSKEVVTFVDYLANLLANAMHLQKSPISDSAYFDAAQNVKAQIKAIASIPHSHLGIRSIQAIFSENESSLYHWVTNRSVPAHNNFSEQQIRRSVISRKVSFGSQSLQGAETRSILCSVLDSARKRLSAGDEDLENWLTNFLDSYSANISFDILKNFPQLNSS